MDSMAENRHYEYVGVIHIHSKHSDGSGTIKEIVQCAKKALVDYVIVTDHNKMAKDEEGWHDGVLILIGEEIGEKCSPHILALRIEDQIHPEIYTNDPKRLVSVIKSQNGLMFAAHPEPLKKKFFRMDLKGWQSLVDLPFDGIEIWSYMHDWTRSVNPFSIVYYLVKPEEAIKGPSAETSKRWDELCQKRKIVGIGVADVHARPLPIFNFVKILSYRKAFQNIRTHILVNGPFSYELEKDRKIVYDAIENGCCFFSNDSIFDSKGFMFEALSTSGRHAIIGEEIDMSDQLFLQVKSPVPCDIQLVKDGILLRSLPNSDKMTYQVDSPGVYRVQTSYQGKPWVFTNPIYIR